MRRAAVSLALLVAAGACGDDKPQRAELPGVLYFVEDVPVPTLVRLTSGTRTTIGRDLFPSPSALPDGRLVAIASRGDGSPESEQIALITPEGRVERLGPAAAQLRDPTVDPRGRWIVVAANIDGHSDLYRVELTGTTTRLTNNEQGNFAPAALGDSIVYVSSRDGDSEIYRDDQRLTTFYRDDWQPTPSPNGRTIAFLSDRDGTPHIYLMNPDGTSLRRLTTHTAEESAPTWSRDGKLLAYVAGTHVWLHDMTSGTDRELSAPGVRDLEPSFSPDSRWLAVSRARGDASDVWVLSLDGGEPVLVAQTARLPRWR
ncbi:MAG TPA: hypothetical protein VIV40_40760 [Kofleriaceae bacterium]